MKEGLQVKDGKGKVGVSLGMVFRYGVWWVLVEYDKGSQAIVQESFLEVLK